MEEKIKKSNGNVIIAIIIIAVCLIVFGYFLYSMLSKSKTIEENTTVSGTLVTYKTKDGSKGVIIKNNETIIIDDKEYKIYSIDQEEDNYYTIRYDYNDNTLGAVLLNDGVVISMEGYNEFGIEDKGLVLTFYFTESGKYILAQGETDSLYTFDGKYLGKYFSTEYSYSEEENNGVYVYNDTNDSIVKYNSEGQKLAEYKSKEYNTKDSKYSMKVYSDKMCMIDKSIYNCTKYNSGKYTNYSIHDGSQSGSNVIIKNDVIVYIKDYSEFGVNITDDGLSNMIIIETKVGDFVKISDAYTFPSIYTISGKLLGYSGWETKYDDTGIYLYDNDYNGLDDNELKDKLMTKYDGNGNNLGTYNCSTGTCVLVK